MDKYRMRKQKSIGIYDSKADSKIYHSCLDCAKKNNLSLCGTIVRSEGGRIHCQFCGASHIKERDDE